MKKCREAAAAGCPKHRLGPESRGIEIAVKNFWLAFRAQSSPVGCYCRRRTKCH